VNSSKLSSALLAAAVKDIEQLLLAKAMKEGQIGPLKSMLVTSGTTFTVQVRATLRPFELQLLVQRRTNNTA
jgi:hypothetical protein